MNKVLIKKKSKIHGFGIFTKKGIEKGKQFYIIPLDKLYNKSHKRYARIGKNKYVSDNKILNWVNHSCNPNTKLDIKNKPKLVAIKDILINEEITANYEKTELKKNKIKCHCKSKNCKGYFYRGE